MGAYVRMVRTYARCVRTQVEGVVCRGREFAMDVILSELRKEGVDIDMRMLAYYINDIRQRHGPLYNQIAVNVNPEEFRNVFEIMNMTNFGRAMAYLTLVYIMDAPEELKREAVRLVAGPLRGFNLDAWRIREEGWFHGIWRRIFG